jgi:hypothetical protein
MAFELKTRRGGDLHTSDDIDDNWDGVAAAITTIQTALLAGAIYITAATTDDDGLTFTLSNGATIGPIAFSGLPWRIMGPWMTGVDYRVGDLVQYPRGTLIAASAHTSGVLATDLGAGKLTVLFEAPAEVQRFEALGAVTVGSRLIGTYIITRDCCLEAATPILLGLATPISGGGSSFNIVVSKVNSGGTTVLGSVTFAAGDVVKPLALDEDLELGDILGIAQVGGGSSTGGANLSISMPLQIGHAI